MITPELLEIGAQICASAILFIAFWLLIGRGVFKTFVQVVEEREEKTTGYERRAAVAREEAVLLQGKIDQILRETRLQGILARDRLVSDAKVRAQELIEKAQKNSKDEIEKARAEIATHRQAAAAELNSQVQELSKLVVERITKQSNSTPQIH